MRLDDVFCLFVFLVKQNKMYMKIKQKKKKRQTHFVKNREYSVNLSKFVQKRWFLPKGRITIEKKFNLLVALAQNSSNRTK